MANQQHVNLLRQRSVVWNTWREQNTDTNPDLREAHLSRADLRGANLAGVDLSGAYLDGADLREANLSGAILSPNFDHLLSEATERPGILPPW